MHLALPIPNAACFVVMLSGALEGNAKHEARLSNISDYFRNTGMDRMIRDSSLRLE
jgi:hypothetical protein